MLLLVNQAMNPVLVILVAATPVTVFPGTVVSAVTETLGVSVKRPAGKATATLVGSFAASGLIYPFPPAIGRPVISPFAFIEISPVLLIVIPEYEFPTALVSEVLPIS